MEQPTLIGVDFSSRPSRRKPIAMALGLQRGAAVQLQGIQRFETLDDLSAWLATTPRWTGGFDLPFGLPRELVQHLNWPTDWRACIAHYTQMTRPEIRDCFAAFCDARPVGAKFAHRACDATSGASPSMKWVNPPVAYMLHAGVPLLLQAQAHLPAHMSDRATEAGVDIHATSARRHPRGVGGLPRPAGT